MDGTEWAADGAAAQNALVRSGLWGDANTSTLWALVMMLTLHISDRCMEPAGAMPCSSQEETKGRVHVK